ncbi:ester cyclase [Mycobacterium sp.]|uniref:ester cyclase n=1 Tax=Mycobacterium sp. TaxID=1785 RepID=UPI003D6C0FC1
MVDPKSVARQSFQVMETGNEELAQQIIAPDFINAEADDDPEDVERQQRGPAGFLATGQWLRDAFSNLRFELQETLTEGNTVIAVATMTGQHTGVFNGIEPTGRPINHKQVHIFGITDARITHHRAVRDDLGLLLSLGWRPGGR